MVLFLFQVSWFRIKFSWNSLKSACACFSFRFLKHQFQKADVDGNGTLSRTEILRLLKHMNVSVEEEYARDIWQVSDPIRFDAHLPWSALEWVISFIVIISCIDKKIAKNVLKSMISRYKHGDGSHVVERSDGKGQVQPPVSHAWTTKIKQL